MEKGQHIDFLKDIAHRKGDFNQMIACALKILRELKFSDKNFLQRIFLRSPRQLGGLWPARKRAADSCHQRSNSGFFPMRELVKKQNREKNRSRQADHGRDGSGGEKICLISFLGENNLKISELIINGSFEPRRRSMKEKLLNQLPHSLWYSRAAIIEILGNRRSELLFDKIEILVDDSNVEVRLKLARRPGQTEPRPGQEYLLQLTKDPHMRVKKEAQKYPRRQRCLADLDRIFFCRFSGRRISPFQDLIRCFRGARLFR